MTLSASTENAVAKATLNDSFQMLWAEDDLIVVVGEDNNQCVYKLDDSSVGLAQGVFNYESGSHITAGSKIHAIYPQFDSNFDSNYGNAYIHLQTEYAYSANTSFAPMVSFESEDLHFKHVGGLVKITLNNVPGVANKVSMTMDTPITGWYTFDPANAGTSGIVSGSEHTSTAGNTVSFNIATATAARNLVFFFPVPVISTKPKITLDVYAGTAKLFEKTASNQHTIGRGEILAMKPLDLSSATRTITVGVINYVTNDIGYDKYKIHYWGGSDGAKDADLTSTDKTEEKSLGSSYWDGSSQTFHMYTVNVPIDITGFKIWHASTDRWFGDDGSSANSKAYIFNYSGDKALYE